MFYQLHYTGEELQAQGEEISFGFHNKSLTNPNICSFFLAFYIKLTVMTFTVELSDDEFH